MFEYLISIFVGFIWHYSHKMNASQCENFRGKQNRNVRYDTVHRQPYSTKAAKSRQSSKGFLATQFLSRIKVKFKMFYVVHLPLKKENKVVVISSAWCYGLDLPAVFRYGINRHRKRLIFYATDAQADPDFTLKVLSDEFVDGAACYMGKIVFSDGKL